MGQNDERFASDSVFLMPCPDAMQRAEVVERLSNPRKVSVGPARLVAVVDEVIQQALEESALVLWESEETIRFELPDARVILALCEGDTPGENGLTLAVVVEGETCTEIAQALARVILRAIQSRYPAFEPHYAGWLPAEVDLLLAQPLSNAPAGLPPVDQVVDQMWRRASACTPPRRPAPLKLTFWHRVAAALTPPPVTPMRPAVRALALALFAFGLVQGPMGHTAQAQTQLHQP